MLKNLAKKLTNNLGLKVLAVLFAIALWIVVVNIDDPVKPAQYTISVTQDNMDYLTSNGKYSETLGGKNTVTFTASAKRSILEKLSNTDFTAVADMEKIEYVEGDGVCRVPITITCSKYNSNTVTISSKQQYLDVTVEDLGNVQKKITASTEGTVMDGCALGDVSIVTSNLLKISGPSSVTSQISTVVATINVDGMSSDVTDTVVPVLYDADGNEIDASKLKMNIKFALAGNPNCGKTTMFNALTGANQYVGNWPGVTVEKKEGKVKVKGNKEDNITVVDLPGIYSLSPYTLEEVVNINGIILNIVDTAGIRDTEDIVEKMGVDKALKFASQADLILYVIDGSVPLDDNDKQIISEIKGKNVIAVMNKNDLQTVVDKMLITCELGCDIVELSASTGDGKEKLYDLLNDKFFSGELDYNDQLYITNARHKEELMKTEESLLKVRESIDMGMEEDFFSIDLMDAYEHLGLIIGETNRDDLADKIFEEFCMGK